MSTWQHRKRGHPGTFFVLPFVFCKMSSSDNWLSVGNSSRELSGLNHCSNCALASFFLYYLFFTFTLLILCHIGLLTQKDLDSIVFLVDCNFPRFPLFSVWVITLRRCGFPGLNVQWMLLSCWTIIINSEYRDKHNCRPGYSPTSLPPNKSTVLFPP